jgi:hypothetical protein
MALQVNSIVVRAFATARDYESAIIPEMTARRLMTSRGALFFIRPCLQDTASMLV